MVDGTKNLIQLIVFDPSIYRVYRSTSGGGMTLTELRYIVAVGQERHFGQASGRCCITQPALSLAIQKLEDELGTRIFERRKNQIMLTPLGEQIVHQAQRVLEEADQIKVIAAQGKDQLKGPLRLGVIATVGPYLLPDLVPLLNKRAPDMPLEIEENMTANLVGMLKSGRLDVIMIALPFEEPGLVARLCTPSPSKRWFRSDTRGRGKRSSTRGTSEQRRCCCRTPATGFASRCWTPVRNSAGPMPRAGRAIRWK
jgi:DNA-binding transcriptional LysR family regulator